MSGHTKPLHENVHKNPVKVKNPVADTQHAGGPASVKFILLWNS